MSKIFYKEVIIVNSLTVYFNKCYFLQKESELQRKIKEFLQQGGQTTAANTELKKIHIQNNVMSSKYQPLELVSSNISSQSEFKTVFNDRNPVTYTEQEFNQTTFNSLSSAKRTSRSQLIEQCSMSQLTEKQVRVDNSQAYQHFEKGTKFIFSTTSKERCSTANDIAVKNHDIESLISSNNITQNSQLTNNLPNLQCYKNSARSYNEKYRRNGVPPLKPICNNSTVPKKRKLYNPDSSFVEYTVDGET